LRQHLKKGTLQTGVRPREIKGTPEEKEIERERNLVKSTELDVGKGQRGQKEMAIEGTRRESKNKGS